MTASWLYRHRLWRARRQAEALRKESNAAAVATAAAAASRTHTDTEPHHDTEISHAEHKQKH